MSDPLAAAVRAYHAKRAADAAVLAVELWNARADFRAAALLALIALDRDDVPAAYEWTVRALVAEPKHVALHVQAARVARRLERDDSAIGHLQDALRLDTTRQDVRLDLARVYASTARWHAAARELAPLIATPEWRDRGLQALIDALPVSTTPEGVGADAAAPPVKRTLASVITCSVDSVRLDRALTSYRRAFGDWPWELIHVPDARGLAEGYTRGMKRANGEILIFAHDDIEVACDRFGERLASALAHADVVGIAGAERACGPAWSHAGQPYLHGALAYPVATGYEVHVYDLVRSTPARLTTLDGVLLAMRADTAHRIGWDATTFPGWHGYDVDFCLRATGTACVLHAAHDLGIVHHSRGTYGPDWQRAAAALVGKHPTLNGERGATHAYSRRVASLEEYVALMRGWDALSRLIEDAAAERASDSSAAAASPA